MRKISILCLTLIMIMGFAVAPVAHAQDEMASVTCDSSLVTLLLVAEWDYDYLSSMMMMEGDEAMMMPHIDYGQYQPLIDGITAMMMEMMESGEAMEEGDMAAHDEMLSNMMDMGDGAAMVAAYMDEMGMSMDGMSTTVLTPGNIEGEDAACAQARADVEKFLVAHILTEMGMMEMDEG